MEARGGVLHLISETWESRDVGDTGKSADSHNEPMRIRSEALEYTGNNSTLTALLLISSVVVSVGELFGAAGDSASAVVLSNNCSIKTNISRIMNLV